MSIEKVENHYIYSVIRRSADSSIKIVVNHYSICLYVLVNIYFMKLNQFPYLFYLIDQMLQ